jgi:hypothetical protein
MMQPGLVPEPISSFKERRNVYIVEDTPDMT